MPLQDPGSYRSACIIGSGVGGLTTLEFSYKMLFKENKRATHPLTLLKAIGSSASAHVSIEYGIKGPTFGVVVGIGIFLALTFNSSHSSCSLSRSWPNVA